MSTMEEWTAAVCADLGLELGSADLRTVLDLTRDVAHGVARPAAPFTAYLVGVAVGRGMTLPDAAGRISALAAKWIKETPEAGDDRALPDSYGARRRRAHRSRGPVKVKGAGCSSGRAKGGQ